MYFLSARFEKGGGRAGCLRGANGDVGVGTRLFELAQSLGADVHGSLSILSGSTGHSARLEVWMNLKI